MKNINNYISEKLNVKNINIYKYHPKTKEELKEILKERLAKNKNANLNNINVSEITDMSVLFYGLNPRNIDISEWDVSNVKDMYGMFYGCNNFNSDLNKWDVSKVQNMAYMFDGCSSLKHIPSWYKE